MFSGCLTALVTPMKDGELDERSLRKLLRAQRAAGVSGVVPTGCTGEAATLTADERARVLAVCLEEVGDAMPVVPGTGTNSTRGTVELTLAAQRAGARGALVITPYYNRPSPEGQYRHYRAVAEAAEIPIVLYNVPSRTGVNMLPETIARLAEIPRIVAVKEASGSLDQVSAILSLCDITVLSGDDPLTLPMLSVGAKGVVSVASNVVPRLVAEMVGAYPGDPAKAAELHARLWPIARALFVEANPGPVKHAMAALGLIESGELRPPLAEVTAESRQRMARGIDLMREALGGGA
ncbi:MAG: 4-hydroxy-tetrahydrodipicolinate synthase [Candidatus Eisenbacteria bacterium]|nr:4-hydroxy-tetrahydrodipicolinate synthase [Candidatus Eisenbacteria bacterium]